MWVTYFSISGFSIVGLLCLVSWPKCFQDCSASPWPPSKIQSFLDVTNRGAWWSIFGHHWIVFLPVPRSLLEIPWDFRPPTSNKYLGKNYSNYHLHLNMYMLRFFLLYIIITKSYITNNLSYGGLEPTLASTSVFFSRWRRPKRSCHKPTQRLKPW